MPSHRATGSSRSVRPRHGELHRLALGEALVPGGQPPGPRPPILALVAEVEIAKRASDRDLADRRAAELGAELPAFDLDLERAERTAHLPELRVDPIRPLEFLGPHRLVAAEDRGLENA